MPLPTQEIMECIYAISPEGSRSRDGHMHLSSAAPVCSLPKRRGPLFPALLAEPSTLYRHTEKFHDPRESKLRLEPDFISKAL